MVFVMLIFCAISSTLTLRTSRFYSCHAHTASTTVSRVACIRQWRWNSKCSQIRRVGFSFPCKNSCYQSNSDSRRLSVFSVCWEPSSIPVWQSLLLRENSFFSPFQSWQEGLIFFVKFHCEISQILPLWNSHLLNEPVQWNLCEVCVNEKVRKSWWKIIVSKVVFSLINLLSCLWEFIIRKSKGG